MMMEPVLERIERCGLVAVLTVDDVAKAVPLAKALLAGGIDVMELTLRTEAALEALAAIKKDVPDMFAGAGTVLTVDQVEAVKRLDADFAVAPGLNPAVVSHAGKIGLPFAPGICTPSDIERAVELGCRLLKFFPAEPIGGLKYLKSMAAPYAHLGLKYIPLGGLNTKILGDYLSCNFVAAVGGSWIASREAIQSGDWDAITNNAAQAAEQIRQIRNEK
ncbi:MAG: bifunctional 4-hydroxy-2-oxoglutarate aldolase/2-dehydro-3-deoxy-phosphogluconate aldolase [Phycisphaerae bacterium]|nr:bifunctional 4-hydroxy-2-oxoglutarate aldolase/2-dehydro-3-deoxy-phosphogluconate aldolase [Phycisphaerae bacterium]